MREVQFATLLLCPNMLTGCIEFERQTVTYEHDAQAGLDLDPGEGLGGGEGLRRGHGGGVGGEQR